MQSGYSFKYIFSDAFNVICSGDIHSNIFCKKTKKIGKIRLIEFSTNGIVAKTGHCFSNSEKKYYYKSLRYRFSDSKLFEWKYSEHLSFKTFNQNCLYKFDLRHGLYFDCNQEASLDLGARPLADFNAF